MRFRVGPLYADSEALAELLLTALLAYAPANSPVFIDMPECNDSALALAKRYAMPLVFEAARMYTQTAPQLNTSKVYGVTTLELG